MPNAGKVVVTGISGTIGAAVRQSLKDRWELSGVDLRPCDDVPTVIADIADQQALAPALQGAYAVVHLAANPRGAARWDEIIGPNILGTVAVFEAAREAEVRKIVFASTNHVTGLYTEDEPYRSISDGRYGGLDPARIPMITHTMPIRPDSPYAISKAFGEATGRYYSDTFGIEVLCLRIGTVVSEGFPSGQRSYATLLTHRDAAALIEACLRIEGVPFDIFYGVSANTWRFWDIDHAKEVLGWTPQDNAEDFRPASPEEVLNDK